MIVGGNGSGKTNLLQTIISYLGKYLLLADITYDCVFFIVRIESVSFIVTNIDSKDLRFIGKSNFEIFSLEEGYKLLKETYSVVLLSNIFDPFYNYRFRYLKDTYHDLTTSTRFLTNMKAKVNREVKSGRMEDFSDITELLFSRAKINSIYSYEGSIDLEKNDQIVVAKLISIRNKIGNSEQKLLLSNFIEVYKKFHKDFSNVPDKYSRTEFNIKVLKKSFILHMYAIIYAQFMSLKSYKLSGEIIPKIDVQEFFNEEISVSLNKLQEFINYLNLDKSYFAFIEGLFIVFDNDKSVEIGPEVFRFKNQQSFDQVFSLFKETPMNFENDFFIFVIQTVSSGEYASLLLFARLYRWSLFNTHPAKNIVLLLDEPDLYLHPQWQKQLISKFIEFCNVIFSDKKVQIIMTTNNAIPVSDVLRDNIVLLGDNSKKHFDNYRNTFGGNIFNLLNDTFFIKDGFIGDFAQMKIQELIEFLYEKDEKCLIKHMDTIEKKINLIGEELIKNKLLDILEQRLRSNLLSIKSDLSNIEERLSKLENRSKDE